MKRFIASEVMRLSAGAGSPGLYLPLSTPCASGEKTIWEMPFSAQSGMISTSGPRQSSEYCGWLETNFSTPGTASASRIFSAGHSLKPM